MMPTIDCVCENGQHDFIGFSGEIETETCKLCDGTGNAICRDCDERATTECGKNNVPLCDDCKSLFYMK